MIEMVAHHGFNLHFFNHFQNWTFFMFTFI